MESEEMIKYIFYFLHFVSTTLCVVMGTFCKRNVSHRRSVLRNRMYRFVTVL